MFKFRPILKSVLWGGNRIAPFKHLDTDQAHIGESWEISGIKGHESIVACGEDSGLTLPQLITKYQAALMGAEAYDRFGNEFPLLVKFIDAASDLSVQVHPNDDLAARRHGCQGKTEMWYVIDAAPGALIHAGFSQRIDAEEYGSMTAQGTIMNAVQHHDSHAGDAFMLPPGTIHSIGAGNLLVEIQQSSDITYRVYDYGRRDAMGNLRPLHTDLAREALDFEPHSGYKLAYDRTAQSAHIASCRHFVVSKMAINGSHTCDVSQVTSFVIMICIDGEASLADDSHLSSHPCHPTALHRGDTVLIPACASSISIKGHATFITAHLP